MTEERWLPVVGYEGAYEVSDRGRVRSVDRLVNGPQGLYKRRGKQRKLRNNGNGYLFVNLSVGGSVKVRYVHRLVLEAFVGPCPEGEEACHNNGVRDDNRLLNLRYDTRTANQADRRKHGTHLRGEDAGWAVLTEQDVFSIRNGEFRRTSERLSQKYRVARSTIKAVKSRKTWRHV